MKKHTLNIIIAMTMTAPMISMAADQAIDQCIDSIKQVKKGEFVKLESLNVNGKSIYEFEIADQNGFEWELMCDAATGKIIEIEKEVSSADSKEFKAKITEEDAFKIALNAYPGKIKEVEYEVEENGDPSYEIDILGKNGIENKVEVNALTGKIIEVSIEKWEIGIEANENR